jgi:hypothetical protein
MLHHTECADCAGSGEICTGCWAPTDWCDCEQGDMTPMVIACRACCEDGVEPSLQAAA